LGPENAAVLSKILQLLDRRQSGQRPLLGVTQQLDRFINSFQVEAKRIQRRDFARRPRRSDQAMRRFEDVRRSWPSCVIA
jgi:hypothetical protein